MKTTKELEAENKELGDRIAKLEEAAKPPKPFEPFVMPRYDYTANASLSPATMREFGEAAGGGDVVRQDDRELRQKLERIRQEFSAPTTAAHSEPPPQPKSTGWRDSAPLTSPPGLKYVDAQLDAQDRIDKAQLVQRLAETAAVEKATKEAGK